MKYTLLILFLPLFSSLPVMGQPVNQTVTGQVSFLSSQNVYVRFGNTEGINVSDTLYVNSGNKLVPALVVINLSSTSCMCSAISREELPAGHLIIAKKRPVAAAQKVKTLEDVRAETPAPVIKIEPPSGKITAASSETQKTTSRTKQRIDGRLSAASYSDFSTTDTTGRQNFRYTLSFNAANIANSRFSAETYISFRHKYGDWSEVNKDIFNALKIYTFALRYDIDSTTYLKLGRQINLKISNIGAFDGLTLDKSIKRFTVGLVGGSRPGYMNYGFNPKLLQFGGYLSYDHINGRTYSGTSLAFINQLNTGKTDRRFLYFQHSGTIVGNLSLFSSFEIDLFKVKNAKSSTSFDLTSMYASLNYNFSGRFSISGSYDARKNPVYYETYKTLIDSLIDNGLRQSFRLHTNIRLAKSLTLGLQSSLRYLKTDLHQAKNVSGYLTYSHAGDNYFSATLSGNYIESNFLKGSDAGIELLNTVLSGRIQTGIGYNFQDYRLPEANQSITLHTGKADLYWNIAKKLSLSANYEITFESKNRYNRLYLQLTKRF